MRIEPPVGFSGSLMFLEPMLGFSPSLMTFSVLEHTGPRKMRVIKYPIRNPVVVKNTSSAAAKASLLGWPPSPGARNLTKRGTNLANLNQPNANQDLCKPVGDLLEVRV
jgi:hypothetical protein